MKLVLISSVLVIVALGSRPKAAVRTIKEGKSDLTEDDISALSKLFNCPLPKKPWQNWPLGCHRRHEALQGHEEWQRYPWQELKGPICQFYRRCLRGCRSIHSDQNKCLNTNNPYVKERGIKCNCKCSTACIGKLNELMKYYDGETLDEQLTNDVGTINISDDINELEYDEFEENEQTGIDALFGDADEQVTEQDAHDAVLDDHHPSSDIRKEIAHEISLASEYCNTDVKPAIKADDFHKCSTWNFCTESMYPCKYKCSRRCKECLKTCPPCSCKDRDDFQCPSFFSIGSQIHDAVLQCQSSIKINYPKNENA